MDALVAGGTGLIGQALVGLLLAHRDVAHVTSLVRRPSFEGRDKLEERRVDFDALESEAAGMPASHVFCCLGTTIGKAGSQAAFERVDHDYPLALGRLAARANAEVFTIVTALGADARSRVFYNRVKGRVEEDLIGLGLRRLRILRPSLLLGERKEARLGERVGAAIAKPMSGLLLGGLRKYRPVPAEAVARAMLEIALHPGDEAVRVYPSDELSVLAQR